MPRRQTYSAAGALAAALLVALPAAAVAQEATGQPLRGSVDLRPDDTGQLPPGGSAGAIDAAQQQPPAGQQDDRQGTGADGLGGIGDRTSPVPGEPLLGGIGDEILEPEPPDVPELGLTTESGEASIDLPGTRDVARHRALPPERHDLDPYVPIGMKLGSFLLFSEAEIGTILTDNVLGTRLDAKSDAAIEVAPDIRLESNWSRHFFMAEFNADRSWYKNFPVEDDRIYQALLRGRLDVTRRNHLELELEQSQTQEGRNSVSLTDIAGAQTNLYEKHITASADHTFNRLTLKLSGTVADYNYDEFNDADVEIVDPTIIGPVPFQDIRDYREDELLLRGTYEFHPELSGFVESSVNRRDYRQPINSEGLRRGSSGFDALTGLIFEKPRFIGEISVGWGEQQSIEESFSPVEGVLINGDLIWLPTPMTKLEFIARSEISETSLTDSLGAIDRYFEVSLQHAFWRYLVIGGYVSYEIADYVDNTLVDQRVKEGLTAEYYFNPYASVYARYEHTDFFSTEQENDFIENEVRIGMRIRH